MGHEYVEMKNSHAAIEAYRRAVDVNRKDYRAWYGLGQAYELLNMHQYALHYYQHATALRFVVVPSVEGLSLMMINIRSPYDVRLWQAQGASYQEMGRLREAIECLKRALLGADANEIAISLKLARLHSDLDETADAVAYHRRVIDISRAMRVLSCNKRPVSDADARVHSETGGGVGPLGHVCRAVPLCIRGRRSRNSKGFIGDDRGKQF